MSIKNTFRIAGLFLISICLTECSTKKEEKEDDRQACKTIVAKLNTLDNKWYYVGEIEAKTSTGIGFKVPGTITRIFVDEGEHVAKGQLLAELDPQDLKNSYDIARASLNQAEDAMKRVNIMHEGQSISDIKYVEVQTKLEQARSMYAAAKKRLNDTKLYAPVSGVIGKRSIEVGENYGMMFSAFTILDLDEVNVKVPVPEREIPKIKKGDEASVEVLALGDKERFTAHVDEIGVTGDRLTHSYEVKLRIANRQHKLMHGMVCNVQLWPKSTRGRTGFILPITAVKVNTGDDHYVWVARNGKAYRQKVEVGMYSKDGVVVFGGIHDGDHIITEGQSKICEGQKIREVR